MTEFSSLDDGKIGLTFTRMNSEIIWFEIKEERFEIEAGWLDVL